MASSDYVRVRWTEDEMLVIADRINGQWDISKRESWEAKWHHVEATLALIQKAEELLRQQQKAAQEPAAVSA